MVKTTPPGNGSRFLRLNQKNSIWQHFEARHDDIRLLATGPFSEEDLGTKCYHSKTGAVELILNHLIDQPKEYVVQDMTAGADSFASGMFTKFDVTFLVAEPTLRGVSVYQQYKQYARDYDVKLKVIGNKVEDAADENFLREHVGDDLVGFFVKSSFVQALEKGKFQKMTMLEPENLAILETLLSEVDSTPKNWQKFYDQTVEFHIKNSLAWANAQTGEDLTKQVDSDFSLVS